MIGALVICALGLLLVRSATKRGPAKHLRSIENIPTIQLRPNAWREKP